MKITVLGGAGDVGNRIVNEALQRNHHVTAVSRKMSSLHSLPVKVIKQAHEIDSAESVVHVSQKSDLIISALRPTEGHEELLAIITDYVLQAAGSLNIPVIIIGGAARLKIPNNEKFTVLTMPNFLPEDIKPIARACLQQFELCLNNKTASWTYISPPAMLLSGEKTGIFRVGSDTLLIDKQGNSSISMEDFAIAVLDEAETPRHRQQAFTVAY